MGRSVYSAKPTTEKFACGRGSDLRVHFKNTREVARAIRGMYLKKAKKYLYQVAKKQRIIPFTRFKGDVGRHAQCKEFKVSTQGRWPLKSVKFVNALLQNVEANAQRKNLNIKRLKITHIQVNAAAKMRRRTYRAHGRINPYMSSPCHIEIIAEEAQEDVPRPPKAKNMGLVKKTAEK